MFRRQETLSTEIKNISKDHDEYQSFTENTIKDLRLELSKYQDENLQLKNKKDSLPGNSLESVQEMKYKLDTEQQKNEELQKQISSLIKELDTVKTTKLELQQEVRNYKDQSNNFQRLEADQKHSELLQTQLNQQLEYINRLENDIEKKQQKIQKFEDDRKIVSIIENEKDALKKKLEISEGLQTKLVDYEMKLAQLESIKSKWDVFLQKDRSFKTPEDLARELMIQKTKNESLTAQVSRITNELNNNAPEFEKMRQQIDKLDTQLQETQEQLQRETAARNKFQKMHSFAISESLLLREQLKSYEAEEEAMIQKKTQTQPPAKVDTEAGDSAEPTSKESINDTDETAFSAIERSNALKSTRIEMLESLVEKYRLEANANTKETVSNDSHSDNNTFSPLKRKVTPYSSGERVAELTRKVRSLQVELDDVRLAFETQKKDLQATQVQLQTLEKEKKLGEQKTNGVRILELKDNPLARHEKVKQNMIVALRKENEDLLKQLKGSSGAITNDGNESKLVPYSSLERLQVEFVQLNNTINDQTKRMERLKQVFSKKSLEFREAVYSLLGYRVDLLPNKKIRATSVYSSDEDESFVFTPDPKSVKASTNNGSSSSGSSASIKFTSVEDGPLTREYSNLVTFWIKDRKDIPCFLSAVNLELYDKTTKASTF